MNCQAWKVEYLRVPPGTPFEWIVCVPNPEGAQLTPELLDRIIGHIISKHNYQRHEITIRAVTHLGRAFVMP